jgi:acetyl esterase/lipase
MVYRSILQTMCAILILGAGPVAAWATEPPKTTTEQDIVYTKAGTTELKLDLARPSQGDGPFPAMVVIHGGAWRAGSKADVRPILPQFTNRGYVAISPQYRLCPKDAFPAQVHDMKAAVRWLKVNAKKYKVDPERIGAIGFSAGGHLALMLGLTSSADGLEGDVAAGSVDSRIKAVVNYFGPTDLAASDIPDVCKPWIKDFLGGTPQDKPETAAKASPLTFVSKDDAPILTFQGTKDPLVPFSQAIKLADAMSSAGVPGRVELLIGAQHGWAGAEMERTINDTFQFLDRSLKDPRESNKP